MSFGGGLENARESTNSNSQHAHPMVYGTSAFVDEQAKAQATAEFYDYAPQPCVCYGCLVPEAQKKRTFMNSYDNKMMMNKVFAPCCCFCDDEMCMSDMVQTAFYDKPPFRVGMCCFCIPCTCCGPPVIFSHNPKCLCIDTAPCFGSVVKIAPCNLYGIKCCLCFGNPCYVNCSIPVMGGLKEPGTLGFPWSLVRRRARDLYMRCTNRPMCLRCATRVPAHRRLPLEDEAARGLLPRGQGHPRGRARHLRVRLGQHRRPRRRQQRRDEARLDGRLSLLAQGRWHGVPPVEAGHEKAPKERACSALAGLIHVFDETRLASRGRRGGVVRLSRLSRAIAFARA